LEVSKQVMDKDGVKHHYERLQPRQRDAIVYLNETLMNFLVSDERLPQEVEMTVGALSILFDTLNAKGLTEDRTEKGISLIRTLYANHPRRLVANYVNNLGVHFSMVKVDPKNSPTSLYFDESMALLHEAYNLRKLLYGESHPDIAESYINIAALLSFNKRDKERMIDLFKKAYEILKSRLGQYDEKTLAAKAYWIDSQK